jgi:hypothetical protein
MSGQDHQPWILLSELGDHGGDCPQVMPAADSWYVAVLKQVSVVGQVGEPS